jgi:hypothetical protein
MTDTAALRFLREDSPQRRSQPFFRADMTFENAKKLLRKARTHGK